METENSTTCNFEFDEFSFDSSSDGWRRWRSVGWAARNGHDGPRKLILALWPSPESIWSPPLAVMAVTASCSARVQPYGSSTPWR